MDAGTVRKEIDMFDKFGEFDSFGEINELAENLFNEGDVESIKVVAEENGIPEEYAEMYIHGEIPFLCDLLTAALGKIDVEFKELKLSGIMEDWTEYLRAQCMEDETVAVAVRRKDKKLNGMIGELLKWSFENAKDIPKEILETAGVKGAKVKLGIPGMGTAKEIIRKYYLGEKR